MKDHDGADWVNSWLYMFDDVKETQFSLKCLLQKGPGIEVPGIV
jgi:hypothetical protein